MILAFAVTRFITIRWQNERMLNNVCMTILKFDEQITKKLIHNLYKPLFSSKSPKLTMMMLESQEKQSNV